MATFGQARMKTSVWLLEHKLDRQLVKTEIWLPLQSKPE